MARLRPAWTRNIGVMHDEGVEVTALCPVCRGLKVGIDLAALIEIKGRDYDLWNRRTKCRFTPGCEGMVTFMYGVGGAWRWNMRG